MRFEERSALKVRPDLVWERVSNIAKIPKYWHGTKSLEITRLEGDTAYAKVKFAFGGSGEAKVSVDGQRRTLTIEYISGPFRGEQVVSVRGDEVSASWDVKFSGLFRLFSSWNEAHFRSGTKHALERLVEAGLD